MSEQKKHKDAEKTDKSHVRDLPTHKEVKGGGNFKPASPGTGGNKIQPVPTQQGS
jgi:hypothetical protein